MFYTEGSVMGKLFFLSVCVCTHVKECVKFEVTILLYYKNKNWIIYKRRHYFMFYSSLFFTHFEAVL